MQFFSSSQFPFVNSKLPQVAVSRLSSGAMGAAKLDCGWYDSSFDLAHGLEVCEDDNNDTLYQLWELCRN
jgi:hypothetical protein